MKNKLRRVAIAGAGHVGAHCAYSLAVQGIVNELVLVDKNEKKLKSEIQDLRDAVLYLPHNLSVRGADFNELKDCDILVNCVGDITLLESHDRVQELNFTIAQVNDFIPKLIAAGVRGIVTNISNPCDIVTYQINRLSGLPKGHVFGTGTALDTARLASVLSIATNIDHKSILAYMMGEHGASQMVPWSNVYFGGSPLSLLEAREEKYKFDKEEMKEKAIYGGWITYDGKGCTEYGICTTLARLVRAVYDDEKCIIPVSAQLDGEYGQTDIYAGVPCVIGKHGAERILELPLTNNELAEFIRCCADIREYMRKI